MYTHICKYISLVLPEQLFSLFYSVTIMPSLQTDDIIATKYRRNSSLGYGRLYIYRGRRGGGSGEEVSLVLFSYKSAYPNNNTELTITNNNK